MRALYDAEELAILDEFLAHGRAVRAERQRAAAAGEAPDFVPLVRGWGGVTLAYRKRMIDSPAYRLNHEEVVKALEEGIRFAENLNPTRGRGRRARSRRARFGMAGPNGPRGAAGAHGLVAAGTSPNITYEKEQPGTFQLDAKKHFFQGFRAERADGARHAGAGPRRVLHLVQRRRPADLVLRRQPPALRRQRRQGDGVGEARLPARRRAVRRRRRGRSIRRRSRRATRRGRALVGALDDELLATRRTGRAADADDRRGHRERAGRGAAVPARPVLPAAELRGAGRAREGRRASRRC